MDDSELLDLLGDVESDRVERKASLSDRDKVRQAICAFANDLPDYREPGVVFIGANDDGTCAGLPITDELLKNLADMREHLQPFPAMTVRKHVLDGCELAVILVEPSDAPPVRYSGRTWIRVGPRRAIATVEEERRLAEKRRAGDLPFDIRPVAAARLDDLDLDLFVRDYLPSALAPQVLTANERSIEHQLAALRFADGDGTPTVLGVLVVGTDPRRFIPGSYVQFLRIDGTELSDPIKDQKEIGGPLPQLLRILEEVIQVHISVAADITSGPTEIRRADYPIVALQQLARNAIMHRIYEATNAPVRITWFNDRIEIQSPGGPFGQVNTANFGQPGVTDYRNPHLADAMRNLGYVQRFGVGIPLARSEMAKNGNAPPEFTVNETYVLVTSRRRS